MDRNDSILRIGYSGSLNGHRPGSEFVPRWRAITDWIWTYRNRTLQHHTRSGYYLLRGLHKFKEQFPELAPDLQVQLWGLIDPINAEQALSMGVDQLVEIGGYYSKQESIARLAACDVLFLPLETSDDSLFIPGKIFDYLKIGKPILVLGPNSDCTHIIERAGLCIRIDPENQDEIADTLAQLIRNKAKLREIYKSDKVYIENTFHFQHLAKQMANVFEEVLNL